MATTRPFGESYTFTSEKKGGANTGGEYAGIYSYKDSKTQKIKQCLFKQDFYDDEFRVTKVMSEGISGAILTQLYLFLGVSPKQFAEVHLVPCFSLNNRDKSGKNIYVQSIFINNYENDLWKYAYQQYYQRVIQDVLKFNYDTLSASCKSMLLAICKEKIPKLADELEKFSEKNPTNSQKELRYQKKINIEQLRSYQILHALLTVGVLKENQKRVTDMINEIGDAEHIANTISHDVINTMQKPSTAFRYLHDERRQIINAALLANTTLRRDFANLTAPQIFLGNYALHSGNFGVAIIDDKDRLVTFDYGASLLNLVADFDPFSLMKCGIPSAFDLYKNHFLDYDINIIASMEMGEAFANLAKMAPKEIAAFAKLAIKSELNEKYGLEPLKDLCKRLGMNKYEYNSQDDCEQVEKLIEAFVIERLQARQKTLVNLGYGLILEHCAIIENGKITLDEKKLSAALTNHPGLKEYIQSKKFDDYQLHYHANKHGNEIKKEIRRSSYVSLKTTPHGIFPADGAPATTSSNQIPVPPKLEK